MLTRRVLELVDSSKSPLTVRIWKPEQADEYALAVLADSPVIVEKRSRVYQPDGSFHMGKTEYYNIPCAFDIESTSFVSDTGEKCGLEYVWQLAIAGRVMIGRTWEEFTSVLDTLREYLELSASRKLFIYIHNLAFEFQFFHKLFQWDRVFAIEERKPVSCETNGIEFRCSYLLSGYPLAKLHEALHKYKNVRKAVGDLDYTLPRSPETPLTWKELYYCIMDVVVVSAYIDEKIEEEGRICDIPLTKTGYVRRYCRNATIKVDKKTKTVRENRRAKNYMAFMKTLTLSLQDYVMTRKCFQGGFTHASALNVGRCFYNVHSRDFTSSYPAVIISFGGFPMSAPVDVTEKIKSEKDLINLAKKKSLIIDVTFLNLESAELYERIIPESKLSEKRGVVVDNGRVVMAERGRITCTEIDYKEFAYFYTWSGIIINKVIAFNRDYLPTAFVEAVLELYKSKTELKGVAGQEFLYLLRKEMCNSTYGMMVTDIIRAINDYDLIGGEWLDKVEPENIPADKREELIQEYNEDRRRFLYYAWGIYVTSVARANLYSAIRELKEDYIYSDTDSVKYKNDEAHAEYFDRYDSEIMAKMEKAMSIHGLPLDSYKPKTIKGKEKPLGVWDKEPDMLIFKTLGAKRYLYMTSDHEIHLTVAGVNKHIAVPYLVKTYGKYGIFKAFADGLQIPAEYTGKLTHYYIDSARDGVITDYKGGRYEYHILSGVYLEPAEYNLSISEEYKKIGTVIEGMRVMRDELQ